MRPRILLGGFALLVSASVGAWVWLVFDQVVVAMPRKEYVLWSVDFPKGSIPVFITVDDHNGDGLSDVWAMSVRPRGTHGRLLSGRDGRELTRIELIRGAARRRLFDPGDIDGDGRSELGVLFDGARQGTQVWVAREDGSTAANLHLSFVAQDVRMLGDLDGDFGPELVVSMASEPRIVAKRLRNGARLWEFEPEGATGIRGLRRLPDTNADGVADALVLWFSNATAGVTVVSGVDGTELWSQERPRTPAGTFADHFETCSDRDGDGVADLWIGTLPLAEIYSSVTGARLGEARTENSSPFMDLDGDGLEEEVRMEFHRRSWFSLVDVMNLRFHIEGAQSPVDLGRVGRGRHPERRFAIDLDGDGVRDYIDRQPGELYAVSGAKLLGR